MLLYSVYAGFSISALLSYYGDLMKARIIALLVLLSCPSTQSPYRPHAAHPIPS